MARREGQRLVEERAITNDVVSASGLRGGAPKGSRPFRTVTLNVAESPLGWLFGHGHLTERQFAAGEKLREDWERSSLGPRVTMAWDGAPTGHGRGASSELDLSMAQLDAKRRFEDAVTHAGAGLADVLWRIVCAGEGMREAERALGWPARAGKLVLTFALDRVADHYRLP